MLLRPLLPAPAGGAPAQIAVASRELRTGYICRVLLVDPEELLALEKVAGLDGALFF